MPPSDDEPAGLFDGVDDAGAADEGGLAASDPVVDPATSLSATAVVKRWLRDLTYNEVHAVVLGFVPWFLGVLLGHGLIVVAAAVIYAAAIVGGDRMEYLVGQASYVAGGALCGVLSASLLLGVHRAVTAVLGVL